MFVRAAAAAALALLISGDAARLGWGAAGLWHFVFPYFWLFLLLGALRARRRIDDGEVFLAGAAMATLYDGVYAKDLQHGFHPLGIDWPGAVAACFDGAMTCVLSLHALERLSPRGRASSEGPIALVYGLLVLVFGGAICVYGVKTVFHLYRAERLLGEAWPLSDALFVAAAGALALRAKKSSEENERAGREPWIWGLAAFVVWLSGARAAAWLCGAAGLSGPGLYFPIAVWTAAAYGLFAAVRRRREGAWPAAFAAEAAATWRAAGALILALILGSAQNDPRAAGVLAAFIDLPARALFAWAFLTSRLKV